MVGIYMFTNTCNGKSYIGQSLDIEKRYKAHRFKVSEKSLFHDELHYYGFHNFEFCVLEECDVSDLNEREIYYIKEYNTLFPFGYNISPGGNAPHVNALSSFDDVGAIIEHLKENKLTNGQIGALFGISDQMVSDINCGRSWRRDNIEYPIRNGRLIQKIHKNTCCMCGREMVDKVKTGMCRSCYNKKISAHIPSSDILVEQLYLGSFESVARKYGVTSNTIRKWCDKYGISSHSKDYKTRKTRE